jgi:hypothetical protein
MSKGLSEAGRLRELEFRVEALEKKAKERERVENEILENARQWARLNKLGYFLDEKGERILTHDKDLEESFLLKIRHLSGALLRIETS